MYTADDPRQKKDDINPHEQISYEFKFPQEKIDEWLEKSNLLNDQLLDRQELEVQADLSLRKEDKLRSLDALLHKHNVLINYKRNM